MRKLLALVLAAAMIFSLAGCGSAAGSKTPESAAAAESGGDAKDGASTAQPGTATENGAEGTARGQAAEEDSPEDSAEEDVLVPGKEYTVDHRIEFSAAGVTMDGVPVKEYDYTWHVDPAGDFDEVKNAPAEFYTGEQPSGEEAVYVAHDIFYFPQIDPAAFELLNYDGEREWCTRYQNEKYAQYLFGTLPVEGADVPVRMMHTAEEAAENPKLHITAPGTYALTGTWQGQVWVDLGEDSFTDPAAVVTLALEGLDLTCTVAPALVFYQVYEADHTWEDRDAYTDEADLSAAGANLILADDLSNRITGTNVYRMLKTKYKDEDSAEAVKVQKKLRKTDGAVYSYMSMNVDGGPAGNGRLNIKSSFEGLDTELHLALNSGCVRIESDNDGINVNEDGVSVAQFNGADVSVVAGLGREGDGIDSNGFVLVQGGTVFSVCNPASDSGIDAANGYRVTGGTLVALGSSMDVGGFSKDSTQPVLALSLQGSADGKDWLSVRDKNDRDVIGFCQQEHEDFAGTERSFSGAVISSPALRQGESYRIYYGENLLGYATREETQNGQPGAGMPGEPPKEAMQGSQPEENMPGEPPIEAMQGSQPEEGMLGGPPIEAMQGSRPEGSMPGEPPKEAMQGGQPEGGMPGGQPWAGIVWDPKKQDLPGVGSGQETAGLLERPEGMPEMPEGFGGGFAGNFGGFRGRGTGSGEIYTHFDLTEVCNSFRGVVIIHM